MKKIKLFLFALMALTSFSSWAAVGSGNKLTSLDQLNNSEAFTLSTSAYKNGNDDRGALVAVGDAVYSTTYQNITVDAASTAQQFAIVSYNNAYYLFNISAQKFMNKGDGENAVLSSIGEPVTLQYADGGYWKIYFSSNRLNFGNGGGMSINTWNYDDQGNKFDITSVGDASTSITAALELLNTKDVTFNVKIGDVVKGTTTAKATIGKAPVIPASLAKDYCTYTYDVTTVTSETSVINASLSSFDGPFNASASYAEAVWYFLKMDPRGYKYSSSNADGTWVNETDNKVLDELGQWAFIGNPYDGFKIYNKGQGADKTLQVTANINGTNAQLLTDAGTTNDNLWFIVKDGDNFQLNASKGGYINNWGGGNGHWAINTGFSDAGNRFAVEAVPQAELTDVTYNITYNNVQVATATVQQYVGETPELPSLLNLTGLCTYVVPTTPITANATYNVTATWVGPFSFSSDYASAEWKNLRLSRAANNQGYYKYLNYDSTTEPYTNIFASEVQRATDEYQWAFLGNPYAVKIINKARGANYSLTLVDNNLVLRENVDGMSIAKSTTGFAVVVRNDDGSIQTTINDNGNKLGVWSGSHATDEGSDLIPADVPEPDYAAAVKEAVTPCMASAGKPFGLKQSVYDANVTKYTAALESCNKTTYDELVAAVTAADAINEPATGYYRIYNTSNRWKTGKGYIGVKAGGTLSANIIANGAADNDIKVNPEWAATVIRVNKVDGGYTFAIDGKYIGQPNGDSSLVPLVDAPVTYTYELYQPGVVKLKATTNNQWLHRGNNAAKDIIAWYENGPSDFSFEAAENIQVPLGAFEGQTYATLNVPFAVTIPDGVTAYTGVVNGNYLNLTVVETTIPTNTPVVLEATEDNYTFDIDASDSQDAITPNDLRGTLVGANVDGALTLQVIDGQLGFYTYSGGMIAANKAYLSLPAEVKALSLRFDDITTGISEVCGSVVAHETYDMAGRHVNKPAKGLYIVGGKKVVVK